MDNRDDIEGKVREAIEAALEVYAGDKEWRGWAEAWLSTRDRTYLAALRVAYLIPGTEEFFAAIQGWFQKAGELNAEGHQTHSETFENAMAEQVGQFERVLPRLMDREAARSQAAAGSAFWSTMSAFFAGADRSEEARICAENSMELCEMLREDDDDDDD
jgi:hypothetical protein